MYANPLEYGEEDRSEKNENLVRRYTNWQNKIQGCQLVPTFYKEKNPT